jgi:glycosyltransferase involved in cell wall biosynthesis
MRILFFSPYYFPYISGITTYPLHVLSNLAIKDTVRVLTFRHESTLPRSEIKDKVNIVRMPFFFRLSKGFISPQSLVYFWKELQVCDAVVVNIPNVEGVMLVILAKLLHKPVLAIYHCKVFFDGSIWKKLIAAILSLAVEIQVSLADKVIVYTKDYALSVQLLPRFSAKTLEIPPPIPDYPANLKTKKEYLEQKNKEIWIGFAGRTAHEKGLEYLVEAVSLLQKTHQNTQYRIVCAGPYGKAVSGENTYFESIVTMTKVMDVQITFLGTLFGPELMAYYESIDVLVLPSINQTEAFGMVQIEAMNHGTCVVASDLPGVRIPVETTGMGYIVPPASVTHIQAAIETVLDKKQPATSPNLENFRLENSVAQIVKVIRSLSVHA